MFRPSRLLAASFLALGACAPDVPATAPESAPRFGKTPINTVSTASWEIFGQRTDGGATSVTSDGRGVYQHAACGVEAKIFYWTDGGAGDATFDPDASYNRKSCSAPRQWSITFPDGTTHRTGKFVSALKMSTIPAGTTTVADVSFTLDLPNCTRVLFRNQVVTRTTSATGKPQWHYESGAGSSAICRVAGDGGMVDIGQPLAMTLRIVITQH